ncbi:Integrator complex subunit 1 [Podila horticola]|nr:Integrator complex subunit 1 [Podila horticola]
MSKDPRKGKASGPERLPDLIPLGRAPSRTIKSSVKLEPHGSKGSPSSSASGSSTHTPPLESSTSSLSQITQDSFEGASIPIQKKARITTNTTSDSSAPSTPPKSNITAVKNEDITLKSVIRKVPGQTHHNRHQSLWSLSDNVRVGQETVSINPRQVDDEVTNTFSRESWQEPPPLHHIRQALQYLKSNALKPDQTIASGLLRLGRAMPELLREPTISVMMIQMLRPEFTHSFKIRTNGAVVFLVCTLLHQGWNDVPNWPTDFVMAYLEDATGERSWCANAETKQFVANILTAFRTDGDDTVGDKFDPVRLDEKSTTSAVMATIDIHEYAELLSIMKRYNDPETKSLIKDVTLRTIAEQIPMCIGASAADTAVRSMIKLMMATCRWVEVRQKAMSHMEFWLGSFPKNAKPLLRMILRQISSQPTLSDDDLETWFMLLDFRYKSRTHQVEPVKEELRVALSGLAGQEMVRYGLQHIMAAELNPNELKNPYHLDLMELLLQSIPEKPAVEFGQLIQGCTIEAAFQSAGAGPSNPALAPVVLVIKRWIRHLGKRSSSWNADVLVGLLMDQGGTTLSRLAQQQELSARAGDISTYWLQILTEVICYVLMANTMDAREAEEVKLSKFSIAHAHAFILRWFQAMIEPLGDGDTCRTPFGTMTLETVRLSISRILFLEPPMSYAMDTTTQEIDSTLIFRVVENGLPLTDVGLIALLDTRLPPKMLLVLVGDFVARATDLSRFYPDSLVVKNPDVIVKIFNLSKFTETANAAVLAHANTIPLAWTQTFWTCSLIVAMLACCNPRILALIVWDSMPVIRTLLEICISQHYSFPPPNYTSQSDPSSERVLRLGIQADQSDKEIVLVWEKESMVILGTWDTSRTTPLQLSESEYAGQLMRMDFGPSQPARQPPPEVLQQLRGLNERYSLGMKLAGSREPDYLRRMVGSNDDAAWVDRLLRDVPGIMNALPASTLCARYCRSILNATTTTDENGQPIGGSAKDSAIAAIVDTNVRKKMIGYLESVMSDSSIGLDIPGAYGGQDPLTRFQEVRDIFEFFLSRLSPSIVERHSNVEKDVQETKQAMEALFQSATLKWPVVLARTVFKTPGTGFLGKTMDWIETITAKEDDILWLEMCLEFLLKVEGSNEDEQQQATEKSLQTLARLFTTRPFVWEWLVRDKEPLLRLLIKRVDQYFSKQDSDMEDGEMMSSFNRNRYSSARNSSARVQVKLDGENFDTFPEILWLALLVLSVNGSSRHDSSTWSKLLMESSQAESMEPKRLVNGAPLLSSDTTSDSPAFARESQLRKRLSRTRDPEIVKVSLDGMPFVQVIDVVKEGLGLDLKVAQVVHRVLLDLLEKEHGQAVPVHLDSSVIKRIVLLLQYYSDQGGAWSQKALVAFKARFNCHDTEMGSSGVAGSEASSSSVALMPNFFQAAAMAS